MFPRHSPRSIFLFLLRFPNKIKILKVKVSRNRERFLRLMRQMSHTLQNPLLSASSRTARKAASPRRPFPRDSKISPAPSTTASSFIQASTTRFSVFDTAYFGGSATSTFDSAGNLSVAGTLTATNGLSTLSNLLTTGSSTLQNFTFVNATGTSATSTNFAISGISSGSLLKTTTGGAVIAAVAGTDYAAASSVFAFPWSATTNYAAAANSTSTPIWFQQGLQASSTSQIAYASTTAITATTASTTNLIASNSFTLASLTGFLKATAGAVATSLIDLTSDITGILGVTNGGTGW